MTHIFKGVPSGLGEEQDDTREHDYEVHCGEESICSPSNTVKHGSSYHNLQVSNVPGLSVDVNFRRRNSTASWTQWRGRWLELEFEEE